MNVSPTATRHTESSAATLRIRTAETPADWQIAHGLFDDEHLLGAGRATGSVVSDLVALRVEVVALDPGEVFP